MPKERLAVKNIKTMQEIIQDILDHVSKCGGEYKEWYCGIASDPKDRLFNDHNVSEKLGHWIFKKCSNSDIARDVEKHLINLGFDGGTRGGDEATVYVYVYKKTADTVE